MALSDATTGWGTELHIDVGAGLIRVAEIDDIPELPSKSQDLYETTNFDSVGFKEWKKLPIADGEAITIAGNYVIGSAAETTLKAAEDSEEALPYKIVLKQGGDEWEAEGNALFYSFKRMNPKDSKRTFQITLKPVDEPTFAEAA